MLTERGLSLRAKIEAMGYRTVECYPGGAQDVWGLPRQHRDLEGLRAGLNRMGVRGLADATTGDELDAVTAALVGRCFLLGRGEILGGEGGIVMPFAECNV
jgi:predicted nuclease with RNAse H fold